MKATIKAIVVALGCAGTMRFAWYRRLGTWLLQTMGGADA